MKDEPKGTDYAALIDWGWEYIHRCINCRGAKYTGLQADLFYDYCVDRLLKAAAVWKPDRGTSFKTFLGNYVLHAGDFVRVYFTRGCRDSRRSQSLSPDESGYEVGIGCEGRAEADEEDRDWAEWCRGLIGDDRYHELLDWLEGRARPGKGLKSRRLEYLRRKRMHEAIDCLRTAVEEEGVLV